MSDDLVQRLDDVRTRPGFPSGTDEAIVAMSVPETYTACPNPYLRDWLERTGGTTDSDDYVDPGPYTTDVTVGKGDRFYKAHSYPTKVPHPAIMRFLLHYTKPGDLVLDGFAGTGMTGVAAQACGMPPNDLRRAIEDETDGQVPWGYRRAVLQDLSPSATFIAAGVNLPVDARAFDRRSAELLDDFDAELGWMYQTTHTNGRPARIDYTIWSEVFTCPVCAAEIVFYDRAFNARTGRVEDDFTCGSCGAELTKKRVERRKTTIRTLAGDTTERIEFRPVKVAYRVGKAKHEKDVDEGDLAVLRRIAAQPLAGPVPTMELPYRHMTHERAPMPSKGFTHVHHFWGDRALLSLSWLWKRCLAETDPTLRLALCFWVEQAFWGMSWQNRYVPVHYSHVNQYLNGVYYVPSLHAEASPWYTLVGTRPSTGKRESLVKLWASSPARSDQVVISTESSTGVDLPDASVDYVFVDPPFGSNIYYADLGLLVEAWHGVLEDSAEEAIEDQSKLAPKSLRVYGDLMERCFAEFHRVLKPGRWMTVEFSNHSNEVWLTIQKALSDAGFVVADTRVFDKQQGSYRQVTAINAVKRDLIISAYRPAAQVERAVLSEGGEDGLWAFVRDHLGKLPVFEGKRGAVQAVRERYADRLYDRAIAYHVHHQMAVPTTAAEFYEGLDQRFSERDGMYFLADQLETYERARMTVKDLVQAELFITSEASAVQWLRQQLKIRPRRMTDLHAPFLAELQNALPDWEDMPDLTQLLEDHFLQDDDGRWYVPNPQKEEDLEKLRTRAMLKEFEQYATARGRLVRFRTEAVQAGFRHAYRRDDFDVIVAVGGRLPDELFLQEPGLLQYLKVAESHQRR